MEDGELVEEIVEVLPELSELVVVASKLAGDFVDLLSQTGDLVSELFEFGLDFAFLLIQSIGVIVEFLDAIGDGSQVIGAFVLSCCQIIDSLVKIGDGIVEGILLVGEVVDGILRFGQVVLSSSQLILKIFHFLSIGSSLVFGVVQFISQIGELHNFTVSVVSGSSEC